MKKTLVLSAAAVFASLGSSAALAQAEGNWMMRIRAVDIQPDNKADPIGGVGASDRVHISNKTIPEVDFSYFFTKNIAAELILTYPQKHDVSLDGTNIGTLKHLPPTLTVQYHFMPDSQFRPYVGAGVNYTRISSVNLLNGAGDLSRNSWGGALQAGFDFKVGQNSYINVDVKKVYIDTDLSVGGTKVSNLKVDPILLGVGYGFKF